MRAIEKDLRSMELKGQLLYEDPIQGTIIITTTPDLESFFEMDFEEKHEDAFLDIDVPILVLV